MEYLSTGRRCLECGAPLRGRADKKYCSAQCRSMYNNRLNSDVTNFVRHINHLLRKNRRILAALNPEGKARVHREKLLEMGFRFGYFTNEYVTRSGNVYRFCYEQGYLELDQDYFALVVRKEYVD